MASHKRPQKGRKGYLVYTNQARRENNALRRHRRNLITAPNDKSNPLHPEYKETVALAKETAKRVDEERAKVPPRPRGHHASVWARDKRKKQEVAA